MNRTRIRASSNDSSQAARTDRDRRPVGESAAAESFRRLLSAAARLSRHTGESARTRSARPAQRGEPRADRRAGRHRRRVPRTERGAADRDRSSRDRRESAVAAVRRHPRSRRRASARRRARRRDGPVPQDRTRALSRPHALARLQHRRDQRAPQTGLPDARSYSGVAPRPHSANATPSPTRCGGAAPTNCTFSIGSTTSELGAVARTHDAVPAPEENRWRARTGGGRLRCASSSPRRRVCRF